MKSVNAAGSATTLSHRPIMESMFSGLGHRLVACRVAAMLSSVGLAIGLATAQPVVVDQFVQPAAELTSLDGGRGFDGSWNTTFQSLTVAADGLSYSDPITGFALATSGGRATNLGVGMNELGNFRSIGINVFPSGTDFWGSFLVRRPADTDISGRAHVSLVGQGPSGTFPPLKFGISDSQVEIVTPSGAQWAGYLDFDSTALILFRAESFAGIGGGPVSVWVNPPLSGALPAPSTVLFYWNFGPYGPSSLSLEAAGGNCSLDEIRLGLSAATVLPKNRVTWPCSIGGNGHQYETVHTPEAISWEEAAAAATLRGGRLATLTSAEENQFVFDNLVAREDVWDRQYGDLFFVDTRGPWIGASRPTYFPDPLSGWEWNGGEPWDFTSWSPEGLVGIGERYASFYMGSNQATPTWRNANLVGDARVHGYVVEYDSAITQQPQDAELVPGATVQFSVTVDGDPMSMSFQWFRNGVPLTDGVTPHGSYIFGAASPTLEISEAGHEDCGTYSVQVVTECGTVQSSTARLKVDAINATYVDPENCWIIRIVTPSEPMDWYAAQSDAWSRGGELISIENDRKQALVDAITLEPLLWQNNLLDQQVGPWVGGYFNDFMGQWYWRNGFGFNDTGFSNWAPGQPDNADGFEEFVSLTRQGESGPTQWVDMAAYNPFGGTLPNSYIMEWYSPFVNPYGISELPCGGDVFFDSRPGDHGLVGTYTWNGPDGLPITDGVTPNGTVLSGQGTPALHISNLAQADAGRYDLFFESGCIWQAQFTVIATDCAPPCPADFNQDGGVDGSDIDAFFSAWESGDASADVNQDGGVDGSDIETFFFAWENGGC